MTHVSEMIFIVTTGTIFDQEDGDVRGAAGCLDIGFSTCTRNGPGNNPDRWFSVDRPACFANAVGIAALRLKTVPCDDTVIDAEFDLCIVDGPHSLKARFKIRLPCPSSGLARGLADIARQTSPSARTTRVDVDAAIDAS